MASAAANRYARALVDVVMSPGSVLKPEDAVAQFRTVVQTIADSDELRTALLTPAIQNSRKRAVMDKLLQKLQASPLIRNFVYVIIDHRRVAIMPEIKDAFELLLDERLGFVRAEVTSAEPLDQRSSTEIESELSSLTGKRMRLHFAVDKALLGGVSARIGSKVYDGSVRGQLEQLRRQLTEQFVE
jgi:F-type H+-transporting ATPase subunit delta